MKQSEAWVVQIKSDFLAAEILLEKSASDQSLICQAYGKYQQTVEKSVKALVSGILDQGVKFTSITRDHIPEKELAALRNLRRGVDNTSVKRLNRILTEKNCKSIKELCALAPKFPLPGLSFVRNTEYPFESASVWIAPASEGIFTLEQTRKTRTFAWVFHRNTIEFVFAVRRGT